MEEGFFLKDHTGQHAAQTPHVQAVVVHLEHNVAVLQSLAKNRATDEQEEGEEEDGTPTW